jgi:putative solute:sodium symporter small subunit
MVTARELMSGFGWRRSGVGSTRQPVPRWLVASSAEVDPLQVRLSYWRNIRRVTVVLLAVWLVVTLALPWFATDLNQFHIGRFPLGFWLTSQGAVGIYVVLIVVYIWAVEKIEDAWHDATEAAASGAKVSSAVNLAPIATASRRGSD